MHVWTKGDVYETDDGLRLTHLNRHAMRYERRDRCLTVPVEEHRNKRVFVYLDHVRNWNNGVPLSATERSQIQEEMRRVLLYDGWLPVFGEGGVFAPEGAWILPFDS